ncbi:MAG TPA: hypothetical protein VL978_03140 [Puia sp.]|nr:hypothetical protein [Puia sp.]
MEFLVYGAFEWKDPAAVAVHHHLHIKLRTAGRICKYSYDGLSRQAQGKRMAKAVILQSPARGGHGMK